MTNQYIPRENPITNTPPEKKSSGMAIKIGIGILTLIIFSEIGYITYQNFLKPSNQPSLSGPSLAQETLPATGDLINEEIIGDTNKATNSANTTGNTNNLDQAKVETILEDITQYPVKFTSFWTNYTISGVIDELDISPGTTSGGHDYKLTFVIDIQESRGMRLYLTTKDILNTKITDETDNSSKITFRDLKIGDFIEVTTSENIVLGESIENIFIVKKLLPENL